MKRGPRKERTVFCPVGFCEWEGMLDDLHAHARDEHTIREWRDFMVIHVLAIQARCERKRIHAFERGRVVFRMPFYREGDWKKKGGAK